MSKLLRSAFALASLPTICSAQTITQAFGAGDNAFSIDFVTIGNPNNAPDTTGYGSVAYTYNLGMYEVSRDQIDKANTAGSLGITYASYSSTVNKPGTGISWYEAATYVNWLNTSKGYQAAYKFVGGTFQLWSSTDAGHDANNMFRNSQAKYVIASRDEWYKGAYGNPNGTWNTYATGSNSEPTAVASGTAVNTAVYGGQSGPADITSAGGLSAYGTMGQGGNAYEWNETASDGSNDIAGERRELRGGSWSTKDSSWLPSYGTYFAFDPTFFFADSGFRVASVPEPSSLSLLALGGVVVALGRRR